MKSNYDIMRDRMKLRFLEYDQGEMCKKFGLEMDGEYLYLSMVGVPYRVGRGTGLVECAEDGQNWLEAGVNASMTIFDVLCDSKPDCKLSGKFCTVNMLKNTVHGSRPGGYMFSKDAERFAGRVTELKVACERLGGTPEKVGDVSYRLDLFPFLPVIFQFWDADDEFPASLQFLWDENVLDFLHYETLFYAMGHLIHRLEKMMLEEK